MRRYDDPVDVRRGRVRGAGGAIEGPEQFLWKGRLWKISAVVAQWVETGAWWQSSGVQAVLGADETDAAARTDLSAEREVRQGVVRRAGGVAGRGRPGQDRPLRRGRRGLRPGLRLVRRQLAALPVPGLRRQKMTQQPSRPLAPFDLPAATHSYLQRAAISLHEAMTAPEASLRYACAHVAALRATAALIAARATPTGTPRRGRQKNAWVLLAEIAPELSEWAASFSAGAAKRAAAEAGAGGAVTEREADDLVRDADRFLGLVEESLGMTRHVPVQETLFAARPGRHDHVA